MKVETPTENLLFITVRIETLYPQPNLVGHGTGFFVVQAFDEGRSILFMVTNKHVIAGANRGSVFLTIADGDKPSLGHKLDFQIENFQQRWHGHPNPNVDIAIMPFGPIINEIVKNGNHVYIKAFGKENFPNEETLETYDALEEILIVGYPNGIYDRVNLLPVLRKGITAMPVQADYDGTPTFLIDASIFPGSSGSPVVIFDSGWRSNRAGGITLGTGTVMLLGIVSSVFYRTEEGTIEFDPVPTQEGPTVKIKQFLNLGVAYKASTILDTITDFLNTHNIQIP